ncbi:hypothetical protein E1B28_009038 [Marasmius oreades]|uniref:Uncharacterized protein n=1 Tax=Marasmius oreades TaxID=181124 RepID=A0A9P7S064_9AGAR|nr:uncharacterized protein E1B28_009038 [Marasmius oreades]KAG7092708.1 hypothetical protein E1B28_009038 [Marasmius oreades]
MFIPASLVVIPFVLLGANLPWADAQSTDATCRLASLQWAQNSAKQSPCAVASSLRGVCTGGSYTVQSLPPGSVYLGPSIDTANGCECSTVTYSLMSACALCQNGTVATWKEWSANCRTVSLSTFPSSIPSNVLVPGWAYLDVKTNDIFNPEDAKAHANEPESSALPIPTSSSSTSFSIPTTSALSQTDSDSSKSPRDSRRDMIVGAVVGSILGFLFLVGCVLYLCHFRRRNTLRREASTDSLPPNSPTSVSSVEKESVGP